MVKSILSGTGTTVFSATLVYSAYPPLAIEYATLSPTLKSFMSLPTSAMIPAPSEPGINGKSIGYAPDL